MGFYYQQVKRYYDTFGRQQVHVFPYEDLRKEPLAFVQNLFGLLGINTSFVPDMSREYNVAHVPIHPTLEKLLYTTKVRIRGVQPKLPKRLRWRLAPVVNLVDRLRIRNSTTPPPMPEDVRASLQADYREDILRLQDLLQRDLSHWLAEPAGRKLSEARGL
jgi:hypothetical protein